ncbi:MAG: NADH-quinone oxidoreductase subunit N [Pirellulales bacterium]|nr:NADH-quinone oxidoreductase subunit N [Pirellulales bacterium]
MPSLADITGHLVHDTVEVSLPAFRPELALTITIIVMLLTRVITPRKAEPFVLPIVNWFPLFGALIALYYAAPWNYLGGDGKIQSTELFTGLLIYDALTIYFRAFLAFFVVLFVCFTQLSGIPDREDGVDFYTLVLGATVGMCLMASANHLLIVFLAVEMASVPSYVLAGQLKGRRQASEAAIKYAVYGAGAAGIMLYGISLLAGVLGTVHLPTMAIRFAELLESGGGADRYMALVLGGLMVMVGIAFKLSAVPFHFWCPDVFEGASAEVNAFLSVASKGAAIALLLRVAIGIGHVEPSSEVAMTAQATVVQTVSLQEEGASDAAPAVVASSGVGAKTAALAPVRRFMAMLVGFIGAITCTFGNLAAYGQTNIKRLLAYSTIAHAGYMMLPVSAAIVLMGSSPANAQYAVMSVAFYIGTYLFMNLGAFAIVAFLRNAMRSEEIADYAGLIKQCPGVVVLFSTILFSLIGLPPLAGFVAKFAIFGALADAHLWMLLLVGGLNTVISLFYYLKVVKTMTLDPEPEDRLPVSLPLTSVAGVYMVIVTLPVLLLGPWSNGLFEWARAAAANLL